jgi:hypothetical protein
MNFYLSWHIVSIVARFAEKPDVADEPELSTHEVLSASSSSCSPERGSSLPNPLLL